MLVAFVISLECPSTWVLCVVLVWFVRVTLWLIDDGPIGPKRVETNKQRL